MSSEKTTNLQLNKWVPTDYVKMDEFNENFDKIDDKIGILSDSKLFLESYPKQGNETDDTQRLKRAIADLSDGQTLVLTKNISISTDIITFSNKNNIKIDGNGKLISILSNQSADGTRLQFTNVNGLTIQNLQVREINTTLTRSNVYGTLAFNGCSNVVIDNVETSGSNGVAIHFINSENIRISNCYIHNTKADGIHFQRGSKNIEITNCKVVDVEDDAIGIVSHDINTYGHVRCVTVSNCILGKQQNGAVGSGVAVIGAIDVTISNCIIQDTGLSGVRITDINDGTNGHALGGRINIINNIIYNTGITTSGLSGLLKDGISIYNTRDVLVSNNQIDKTQGSGITVCNSAINVTIKDNYIKNTKVRGIWVAALSQNGTYLDLWNNPLLSDGRTATSVEIHDMEIKNNRISVTGIDGIYVDGTSTATVKKVNIEGNILDYINKNDTTGIFGVVVNYVDNLMCRGNHVIGKYGAANITNYNYSNITGVNITVNNYPWTVTDPTYIGEKKHYYGGTAPTQPGTLGEIVWNWNPVKSGKVGWVYTADGGWKAFGVIDP